MRIPVAFAAVALCVGTARADRVRAPRDRTVVDRDDFWREVVEPHAAEITLVSQKIEQALQVVAQIESSDVDAAGAQRARILDEARGMARYLRRLAPANPEVLLLLARVTDEAGRTDEALEALTAYLAVQPENASGEASLRLGRIYLQMRRYDDAIRHLRTAAASPIAFQNNALVYLASALTSAGRVDEAIDQLRAQTERPLGWTDPSLASFALAVAYDRDEQITEAFRVLDRMQTTTQAGFAGMIQGQLTRMHFVPAADEHYFRALLYESVGYLDEARTSWVLYAGAAPDVRFRRRALAHVSAIDALQARATVARKLQRPKATPPRPPVVPPPRPHPARRRP